MDQIQKNSVLPKKWTKCGPNLEGDLLSKNTKNMPKKPRSFLAKAASVKSENIIFGF
jgi:hypothetical protein